MAKYNGTSLFISGSINYKMPWSRKFEMAHVWVFDPLFFAIRRSIFGGNFHVTRGDGICEVQETLVGLGLTIVDLDLDPG